MSFYWDAQNAQVIEATGIAAQLNNAQILVWQHDPIPGQRYYGPFDTAAQAAAFGKTAPAWTGAVDAVASGVTGGLSDLEGLAIRLAEAAFGIVIIAIALNAVLRQTTGVDAIGAVKSGAKKAAVVAAV